MKLSQFKFKLPEEQIALYPHSIYHDFVDDNGNKLTSRITRRDECKLMVLHSKSQTIELYKKDADGNPIEGEYLDFRNVLDYFDEGDTFVFNDTKIFPARLYGTKEKTDAKIEVFLLRELNQEMRLWDVLDILVVAFFLYRIYILIRDTRATALLKGLIFLGLFTVLAGWLQLHVVSWILDKLMTVLIVALPVVFQPELRRALEQIGRGKFYVSSRMMNEIEWDHVIDDVVDAAMVMSANKIGALIVFERSVGLDDRIDTGIRIEGLVSKELLGNIFIVNTPLHDGAVIIRENRVMAAGCLLPLTRDHSLSSELGTRHRAAIGMSEQADCVVVVVSEETGIVSYTYGGHIYRGQDAESLRNILRNYLMQGKPKNVSDVLQKWSPLK